eukprot:2797783-Pyramimonas_sp.AAC.2
MFISWVHLLILVHGIPWHAGDKFRQRVEDFPNYFRSPWNPPVYSLTHRKFVEKLPTIDPRALSPIKRHLMEQRAVNRRGAAQLRASVNDLDRWKPGIHPDELKTDKAATL